LFCFVSGLPCASKFDKNLSRAVIASISDYACELLFVDFGVRLSVPYDALYHLPDQFISPTSLAMKFKLNNAENIPNISKGREIFSELVKNKKLRLEVTEREENIQCCELYDKDIKISDILRSHIVAESPIEYPTLNLSSSITYRVVTSYVDTTGFLPWSFSVQLESSLVPIDEIMVQISKYCETEATTVPEIITAQKNDPIIAQYSGDSNWYRAKIIENYNGKSANVHFVDYGNTEEVLPSATRPATRKLINNLPPQAILCRLQYVDTLPTASSKFCQITYLRGFDMHIIQVLPTGECLVQLFDTTSAPIRDLAQDIIAMHSLSMSYPGLYGHPHVNSYVMPPYNPALPTGKVVLFNELGGGGVVKFVGIVRAAFKKGLYYYILKRCLFF
jgi:hypothetical protein